MRSLSAITKLACLAGFAIAAAGANGQVVISQVYGGGGNAGAPFTNDYVELYNKGAVAVNLTGYSVQYASAAGAFPGSGQNFIALSGTIQPGGYFLLQGASGANGVALPTPDQTSTFNASATAGKIALVNDLNAAASCAAANVVDVIGFGATASCSEGSPAPAGSNTLALFRGSNGCTDTNNNASDFSSGAPAPRNSSSPMFTCPTATPPSGVGSVGDSCPGGTVTITFTVTPGSNPTSTGITVMGDTTTIGGSGPEMFFNDGTNGDAVANDNIWSLATTVFVSQLGPKSIPATIADAQGRTGNAAATVNVVNCNPSGFATATPAGVCPGESTLITVNVTPGQSPPSTGITVTADLSGAGGSSTQALFDNGSNGDVTAGDNLYSYLFPVPGNLAAGPHALSAQVADAQGRMSNVLNFTLNTGDCIPANSTIVISQVYGGGGNTGATLTNDFIELFNRSTGAVDVSGWSVQYASGMTDADGFGASTVTVLPSGSVIQPGHYYLVQEAAGAGGTDPLPAPDAIGTIAVGATRGVIALVNNGTPLGITACGDASIMDLVGFGNGTGDAGAYCAEGLRTAALSNTTAVIRRSGGCFDTNNNGIDFNINVPMPRNSATAANTCAILCGTADFDGDGDVGTDADIEAFFACLGGNCCATCYSGGADFDADGDVGTDADIEAFFRVLAGGQC